MQVDPGMPVPSATSLSPGPITAKLQGTVFFIAAAEHEPNLVPSTTSESRKSAGSPQHPTPRYQTHPDSDW